MKDIFDAKIFCKNCNIEMSRIIILKKGVKLRTMKCVKCGEKIVHPNDINRMERYNNIKDKTYNVKLRVVGNSHAISIPKEIVDFINASNQRMNTHMNDMVKLAFEDFGKLSLDFFDEMDNQGRKKIRWQ